MGLLQAYPADLLKQVDYNWEVSLYITEFRRVADLSLHIIKETARAIGRGSTSRLRETFMA